MFRIFFLLLVTLFAFNAQASTSTPQTKHQREFTQIQHRFEKVSPLIVEISRKQGVDPKLMITLIYRESRFDPKAYNKSSRAHSLVQMLPSTKRSLLKLYGKELGLSQNADLYNPRNAVLLATAYVKHLEKGLTKRLKRKPTMAEVALAYHWGESGAHTRIKSKSRAAQREMAGFMKDAAFYSAKIDVPVVVGSAPRQLAFAKKTSRQIQLAEVSKIWDAINTSFPINRGVTL